MDELAAWVLAPLALALLSWGVGLLVERAAATRLEGGLVLPVGMAGSMVLLALPFGLGLGAPFAFAFVLIFAAAGAFLGRTRLVGSLPELPLALAVLAAFGLYIAPVVLTGEATFAGYTFLGDNSIHFSLIDHVVDHGSRMTGIPGGSYGEVLSRNLDTGYPLGPHFQAAILTWLLGTDVAWLWQGYIAFAVGMAVLPAASLLRSAGLGRWASAVGAFAAVSAYLPLVCAAGRCEGAPDGPLGPARRRVRGRDSHRPGHGTPRSPVRTRGRPLRRLQHRRAALFLAMADSRSWRSSCGRAIAPCRC